MNPRTAPARRRRFFLQTPAACIAVGALALALTGCSGTDSGATTSQASTAPSSPVASAVETPSAQASPSAGAADSSLAVPGYQVGEIPPIPLFALPDLGLLTASTGNLTPDLTGDIQSRPGITVSPARCDEAGVLNGGMTVVGGDGSVITSDGDSSLVNDGEGSAVYEDGSVSIVNNGDGSGTYTDDTTSIVVEADGTGTYTDETLSVVVGDDGAGTYDNSATGESIVIGGDGSGVYSTLTVSITNEGDGSGTYTDLASGLSIVNEGDGTALVSRGVQSIEVDAEPLVPVGSIGSFPSIDAAQPVESCGTVITLEDGVLFDFGSAEIRADADATLTELAELLNEADVPAANIYGHTDSISDEDFNQTLSEQRAQAVLDALEQDGVTAQLEAEGFGETRPVAPNENEDGSDNPAGRQLNRRVEIYVPAF
ncbi:OmpA family protein [Actinomyces succiniciruminis]|uniref:OmpA protein n=1 Tax=Actinomyces succiniciruminis TaxID=1522002 RepID=A0A1L7RQ05_9ACTO|nr:OmpA family protein [Actinomyces succiniciruminis]CED91223.1 OmpA protein [Actinomyces succiniciruminis]